MEDFPLKSHPKSDTKITFSGFYETKIGSQGLRKQIIRKGHPWQTPSPGDEVEVYFSGYLEGGDYLGSNKEERAPFRFKLHQREVIKGMDEGVATMKKGERAIFTIPPELAYGKDGYPPLVPPGKSLIYDIELLSWKVIRDINGDGGIMKKIIKEGEGWATPKDADEALVKYEARLDDGTLVSRSDEGVQFHIGDGHLCPAISKAVKTMRKGEKAELAVKFSDGFQQGGNKTEKKVANFPSNYSSTIYLELVSWRTVVDVTGNRKVIKKIIRAGASFDHPDEGSLVKVIYTGQLEDGTIFDRKGSSEAPFEFMCLEEQVNEDLDQAIMTMRKGEQAFVTVRSQSDFSDEDSEVGTADSVLHYEVELIDFIKEQPIWKMDTHEKIQACERKKGDGNVLFKAGNFWRASKKYERAAKYVEFDHSFTDEEQSLAKTLWLSCNLNNAACKLRQTQYLEASRLCTKVLERDPLNVKALYRRSQAYLRRCELEKAEADMRKALTIDPNNRDIKLEFKELKEKQRECDRCQAEIFSTMVSKMA